MTPAPGPGPTRARSRTAAGSTTRPGAAGSPTRLEHVNDAWPRPWAWPGSKFATVAAMSRPISGKKLAKLGRRLAAPGPISDDDYAMLGHVAEIYQAVLDKVEERLQRLGYQATTRVKTTGTLVDKLRRPPQLPLGSIHDVAGARIVMDGGRREQDQIVERIVAAFSDCPKPPLKIDRRERPNHGYRAVHVIVFEDSTPVEIQVRTKMQDTWAQITEKLGDI